MIIMGWCYEMEERQGFVICIVYVKDCLLLSKWPDKSNDRQQTIHTSPPYCTHCVAAPTQQ